jgi:hypothetical protein
MRYNEDGDLEPIAVVMPHPNNFVQLQKLVQSVHALTAEAVKQHGPLAGKDAEMQPANASLPTPHPALIRSFPSTGVLKRENIKYWGVTEKMEAVAEHEIALNLGLTEPAKASEAQMYNIAYCYPNNIRDALGVPESQPGMLLTGMMLCSRGGSN